MGFNFWPNKAQSQTVAAAGDIGLHSWIVIDSHAVQNLMGGVAALIALAVW